MYTNSNGNPRYIYSYNIISHSLADDSEISFIDSSTVLSEFLKSVYLVALRSACMIFDIYLGGG